MQTFFRTAAALEQYDSLLDAINNDPLPVTYTLGLKQEAMLAALERSVGTAFYEDTKDINHLQDCVSLKPGPKHGDIGFIRKTINAWKQQQ